MKKNVDDTTYLKILKLVSTKGPRFTTEDLATALGTSKRTVYAYFKDKYDIIDKTIDFVFRNIVRSDEMLPEASNLTFQEKVKIDFQSIPDSYQIGVLIRYAKDFQRYYPELWEKVDRCIKSMWDNLIQLVDKGIQDGSVYPVNTTVLRLMLEQTLTKLLDYEFILQNQISFESGMRAMYDIVLFGIMNRTHSESVKDSMNEVKSVGCHTTLNGE